MQPTLWSTSLYTTQLAHNKAQGTQLSYASGGMAGVPAKPTRLGTFVKSARSLKWPLPHSYSLL